MLVVSLQKGGWHSFLGTRPTSLYGTTTSSTCGLPPAATSAPGTQLRVAVGTLGAVAGPPSLPPSAPLPGFASFLPLCRPPRPLSLIRPPASSRHSPVHAPFTPSSAPAAGQVGCCANARDTYPPASVSASAHSSALSVTNAWTSLSVATPYPGGAEALFEGGLLLTSRQSGSFRPVGVVLKRSSSLLSACDPVTCQSHCPPRSTALSHCPPRSTALSHCPPRSTALSRCRTPPTPPHLAPPADRTGLPLRHAAPHSDVKPVPAAFHEQGGHSSASPARFAGEGQLAMCAPPPGPSLPLYEPGLGVKASPFLHTAGQYVSDNVSVVTLRAPDPSLFMTNQEGTTSQTESEFSLQDVKMQLTVKSGAPDPAPPPPSYSPLARSAHEDVLEGSHPGLDMLSDVSLLVESLKSHDGGDGGRENGGVGSGTPGSGSSGYQPFCAARDVDAPLLCPPRATYVGTVPSGPTPAQPGRVVGDLYSDGEAHYTEMNPPPSVQDACSADDYNLENRSPRKPHLLMLPPKKSCKFTRVADPEPPPDVRAVRPKSGLVLKIARTVLGGVPDTPARRGRPRKRDDNRDASGRRARDNGAAQRRRLGKVKEDPEGHSAVNTVETQSGTQKANTRSAQPAFLLLPPLLNGQRSQQRDDNNEPNPPNFPVTYSVTKNTHYSPSIHNGFPQEQRGDQFGFLAPTGESTSTGGTEACCGYSLPLDHPPSDTSDRSLLPSGVVAGDDGDDTVGCPDSGTRLEDVQIMSATDKSPDFDPLVIAEEEVTSTQTQDQFKRDEEGENADAQVDKPKSRRRSHICVSCFSIPSSSDESSPPSPTSAHHFQSKKKTAKKFGLASLMSKGKPSKTSECSLPCEVCGRKYATPATLTRHKRLFHPSLFSETDIVELPFVAGVPPSLPLSPSSIPSAVSPEILATPHWHAPIKTTTMEAGQGDDESKPQRAKAKWKPQDCDEDLWEPKAKRPKKKKTLSRRKVASEEDGENQENVIQNGKGPGKTVWQKKQKATPKGSQRRDSSLCSPTRNLNFRTKKRTRVNSTVPQSTSLLSVLSEHHCVSLSACSSSTSVAWASRFHCFSSSITERHPMQILCVAHCQHFF